MNTGNLIKNKNDLEELMLEEAIIKNMVSLEFNNLIEEMKGIDKERIFIYKEELLLDTSERFKRLYVAMNQINKRDYHSIDNYFEKYFDKAYNLATKNINAQ